MRAQSTGQHWELSSEFDSLLTQLFAEGASADVAFARRFRSDPATAGQPENTALSRLEDLWSTVFPGRELLLRDWKPVVASTTAGGAAVEYSGYMMSDGEKAALFLAGRVLSADAGVLVVDEPETHLHTLLAARLWDALEQARPDVRPVYITHDLSFALSRRDATYLLCSPTSGFSVLDVPENLTEMVASTLLGAASLSFYASRIVFCEGDSAGLDQRLYSNWFSSRETVVRAVGSCDDAMRCAVSLRASGIASSLEGIGIIDRDFRPDRQIASLPESVWMLPVHEVESLFAVPNVVRAVARHVGVELDDESYLASLRESVSTVQRHQLVVRRWRASVEPLLQGVVSSVGGRESSLDDLIANMGSAFDRSSWSFDPAAELKAEKERVEAALSTGSVQDLLTVIPGKQLLPIAARACGLQTDRYADLVIQALAEPTDLAVTALTADLVLALAPLLPPRESAAPAPRDALPPAG